MTFVHTRRISWADTDPARIAYTGRFLDFALQAVEAWFEATIGESFYTLNVDHGIGTPFVHASLEFRSPLTPRDTLDSEVRLERLGGASLRFAVIGRVGERVAFEASLVCCCVDAASMTPMRIPDAWRERIAATPGLRPDPPV